MNGRCETDPLDRAVDVCDSCFGEFCENCLVRPKGRRYPICTQCALIASGVRRSGPARSLGSRRTAKKRRQDLRDRTGDDAAIFEYFDTEDPIDRVPAEAVEGKKRRKKGEVVDPEPIDAEPDGELAEVESHQDAGGTALKIEQASALEGEDGANVDAGDERATPAVAKLTELRKAAAPEGNTQPAEEAEPDDLVPEGQSEPPPASASPATATTTTTAALPSEPPPPSASPAPATTAARPGEPPPPSASTARETGPDGTSPSEAQLEGAAGSVANSDPAAPAIVHDRATAVPPQRGSTTPGAGSQAPATRSDPAGTEATAPAARSGATPGAGAEPPAARSGATPGAGAQPPAARSERAGTGATAPAADVAAAADPSDDVAAVAGPSDDTAEPGGGAADRVEPSPAAAQRGRRRADAIGDSPTRPTTAPMIGEVRTIGGRRSSDEPEPEGPLPSRLPATTAAGATNSSGTANGIEEFDAGRPSSTATGEHARPGTRPGAGDHSDPAKADTDADGNWIPPVLRGMAPNARQAKEDLPKRQRTD